MADTIPSATISAVNLSEAAAKLAESGMPEEVIQETLEGLALEVHDFEYELTLRAAMLRPSAKHKGLSLADRACLALGQRLDLPILTASRTWEGLKLEAKIRLIRS